MRERDGVYLRFMIYPWVFFVLMNGYFLVEMLDPRDFFEKVGTVYKLNTLLFPALQIMVTLFVLRVPGKNWDFSKKARMAALNIGGAFLFLMIRVYATHIEPYRIRVNEIVLETTTVSNSIRILHISDIQSAAVGDYERGVFERISQLKPDLILFTGDLLQPIPPASISSELPKMSAMFRTLRPPLGIFGVFGNVDHPLRHISADERGGLVMLESETSLVRAPGADISLLGLSLVQSMGRQGVRSSVEGWLQDAGDSRFTILLGHCPDYIPFVQDIPADLCLAGHTHGGQIRIPLYGPPVTLSRIPRDWARGFHSTAATRINVSAGIGAEHAAGLPPIRFNCPPEMTLFVLTPARRATQAPR